MYMRDFVASLGRRWILVVVCLLMTVGLAQTVWTKVPPTYQTKADVVLVPPKSTENPAANRFLDLGGLRQAVDVLTRSLNSDSTKAKVLALAPQGKFEATADAGTSAPIFILTATASSPAAAQKLLDVVLDQVPVNLVELQNSLQINARNQIVPRTVARADHPKAVKKGQIRAVGAVVAFLLLLSAMLVAAVDHILLMRKSSKQHKAQLDDAEELDKLEGLDEIPQANPNESSARPVVKQPASETGRRNVVSAKTRS